MWRRCANAVIDAASGCSGERNQPTRALARAWGALHSCERIVLEFVGVERGSVRCLRRSARSPLRRREDMLLWSGAAPDAPEEMSPDVTTRCVAVLPTGGGIYCGVGNDVEQWSLDWALRVHGREFALRA